MLIHEADTLVGARLSHLTKYSNTYSELYPGATQILVRSEASFFWSSQATKTAYLEPAVEALESLGCLIPLSKTTKSALSMQPSPSILVHAFSNGGASQLTTLGEIIASRAIPPSQQLPVTALVLDSCPGDGGAEGTIRAFSSVVRNPFLKGIIKILIRLLYFYVSLQRKIMRSSPQTILDKMKARLNDRHLLPWFDRTTPRLYLYSVEDKLIPYHEIEAHANQAEQAGLPVRMEKFEDSPHVAHAKVYPQRYWTAIQKLWDDASSARSRIVDHS
ncbi:hypothetical protein CVT25_006992 [Psilocybe cyanescens]|uniref:Uncharacterized protein n=1 Tax=Psilocybe cyanescens TaxID=93625 RepID=A0A409WYF0_PSICY|nr:hypothetical protein CVT25_006992 [Psilocybe cyanescens]